jgi:hypothetical protein
MRKLACCPAIKRVMRNFLGKTKQASSTIAILSNQQCGDEKYLSISDEETRLMSGHQKSDEILFG